jgi:hypothetical protein
MKINITTYDTYAVLSVGPFEQAILQTLREEEPDEWGTDKTELEIMEQTLCNSEWDWIQPVETGDLTDAPMIGIRDENEQVIERYAFMSYAVRSFLDDLADKGECRWEGGNLA